MTLGADVYEYAPQTAHPPGETLKETLEERAITQVDLARRTGLSTKHINQIVQGSAALSPETALLLERVTGLPATVWNALEAAWRTQLAREEEHERLEGQVDWLANFPLAELVRRGVLQNTGKTVDNLRRVLAFFGVASPQVAESLWGGYRAAFRRSTAAPPNEYATSTWLRLAVLEAREIDCRPYRREALQDLLPTLRALNTRAPHTWIEELPELCARAGVALVFSPALKNTRLSGATRWLTPDKAMVALTCRYKTDDQFWFTFFHELGHVLLHGKRLTFLDDDGSDTADTDPAEIEANAFAAATLIPAEHMPAYEALRQNPKPFTNIKRFASRAGIAPGIVVGRLQHENALLFSEGNTMKRRFSLD